MANEEKTIIDHIGTINTTIGGAVKEVLNKVDIPNGGKPVLGIPGKAIDGIVLTDKVAKAPDEKSKFKDAERFARSLKKKKTIIFSMIIMLLLMSFILYDFLNGRLIGYSKYEDSSTYFIDNFFEVLFYIDFWQIMIRFGIPLFFGLLL